jgi:serine/threonine protein kinase
MAAKLPVLTQERPQSAELIPGVPPFMWASVQNKRLLGEGSFGEVFVGKYEGHDVVVKKLKRQKSPRSKDLFIKEVNILKDLKCDNIVNVEGFCSQPLSVMLEYLYFDFKPFGIESGPLASLTDYLEFVSTQDHVAQMSCLQLKIATDIMEAIAFLHSRDIVHRDIKPANILVSNKHYCELEEASAIEEAWLKEGIVCKLADFGESRSAVHQTAAIHHTRTTNFERGTLVYNSPEILAAQNSLSLNDLKCCDVWSLGMVMFMLINPDVEAPYSLELEEKQVDTVSEAKTVLQDFMNIEKKPEYSAKYSILRKSPDWLKIEQAFESCTAFKLEDRLTVVEALKIVSVAEERQHDTTYTITTLVVSRRLANWDRIHR